MPQSVDAKVSNGVVTLRGSVRDRFQRAARLDAEAVEFESLDGRVAVRGSVRSSRVVYER